METLCSGHGAGIVGSPNRSLSKYNAMQMQDKKYVMTYPVQWSWSPNGGQEHTYRKLFSFRYVTVAVA
jgi:hypothetical protein